MRYIAHLTTAVESLANLEMINDSPSTENTFSTSKLHGHFSSEKASNRHLPSAFQLLSSLAELGRFSLVCDAKLNFTFCQKISKYCIAIFCQV